MLIFRRVVAVLCAHGLLVMCAAGSATDLAIGIGADVTAIDPHFHNVTPNNNVALTYSTLAHRFRPANRSRARLAMALKANF